jgi:NAD-dependent deacetylase
MHPPVDHEDEDRFLAPLERAAAWLRRAERVAVLTGAGVSAESGLATFRGAGGLWEGHRIEDVATPYAFRRDPLLVWRFYHARRTSLRSARPNPGHLALAALEDRFGSDRFTLITQNVDGLHRAAGSRHVLEVHGSLHRVRCTGCEQVTDSAEPMEELPRCPACGAMLRPDVVWFGESLPEDVWLEAEAAAGQCDCFLVVGTSAQVYPAAGLIDLADAGGARVIEVNLETTPASRQAGASLHGPSGEVLPELLRRLAGASG